MDLRLLMTIVGNYLDDCMQAMVRTLTIECSAIPINTSKRQLTYVACYYGYTKIVAEELTGTISKKAIIVTAYRGHLDTLQWLLGSITYDLFDCLVAGILGNRYAIVEYLLQTHIIGCKTIVWLSNRIIWLLGGLLPRLVLPCSNTMNDLIESPISVTAMKVYPNSGSSIYQAMYDTHPIVIDLSFNAGIMIQDLLPPLSAQFSTSQMIELLFDHGIMMDRHYISYNIALSGNTRIDVTYGLDTREGIVIALECATIHNHNHIIEQLHQHYHTIQPSDDCNHNSRLIQDDEVARRRLNTLFIPPSSLTFTDLPFTRNGTIYEYGNNVNCKKSSWLRLWNKLVICISHSMLVSTIICMILPVLIHIRWYSLPIIVCLFHLSRYVIRRIPLNVGSNDIPFSDSISLPIIITITLFCKRITIDYLNSHYRQLTVSNDEIDTSYWAVCLIGCILYGVRLLVPNRLLLSFFLSIICLIVVP